MLNQAKEFNEAVKLSGLILTKLDGTARGGGRRGAEGGRAVGRHGRHRPTGVFRGMIGRSVVHGQHRRCILASRQVQRGVLRGPCWRAVAWHAHHPCAHAAPRAGAVISVVDQLGLPVKFIGVGETAEDLQPFVPEAFAEALFPQVQAAAVAAK